MEEQTIVAVYDTAEEADSAIRDLAAAGVPASAINRTMRAPDWALSGEAATSEAAVSGASMTGSGVTGERRPRDQSFWSSLFGGEPDYDAEVYDRSVESGSHIVAVRIDEARVERVVEILERHNPVDIDERAASYGLGSAATTAADATVGQTLSSRGTAIPPTGETGLRGGEERLQLAEEQLSVSKRVVNHGTTRIRRFVVETPVEEKVTLHSERVTIERRPVTSDAPLAEGSFTDRVVEVSETDEEAIVGKTVRVKEEVVIRKDVSDRIETVRDRLRREDVEISKDGGREVATPMSLNPTRP